MNKMNKLNCIGIFFIMMFCGCTSNRYSKTHSEASNNVISECNGETKLQESKEGTVRVLNLVVDTLALTKAYSAFVENPHDRICQENFFKAFPGTWYEFISTYGFSEQIISKSDVTYGEGHINAFGQLNLINDTLYCSKLIDISIGAYIDADAPNYLKVLLQRVMGEKTPLMMELISSMLESDQMLFWGFYWASIHKDNYSQVALDKLVSAFESKYPDEVKIMKYAFDCFYGKSVYSSWPKSHIGLRYDE